MRVLLYSPELYGHHQVYCRVIGRALLDAGCRVTIGCPAGREDWPQRWAVLRPLADEDRVACADLREATGRADGHLTAEQLVGLQRDSRSDATLFIHADTFEAEFRRIAAGQAPRLRGRVCAIFGRTSEWYPGEDVYSGAREPWIGPTLRRTLGRLGRAAFQRRATRSYFFERILMARRLVDALIVKDERLARRYGPPVCWMPEIYRVFDVREDERRGPDWERHAAAMQRYAEHARPANVLLYFGSGAWYKGYDLFLKLAAMDEGAFALHAGAPDVREPGKPYAFDIESLRQDLLRQGRLFETRAFVESADLVDLAFNGIGTFVSTHRLTLTSGTVLQALECGKPVLTPDAGLVGWRTRSAGLGQVYRYLDVDDLAAKWRGMRTAPSSPSPHALRRFMEPFSRRAVERFFVEVVTRGNVSPAIPDTGRVGRTDDAGC